MLSEKEVVFRLRAVDNPPRETLFVASYRLQDSRVNNIFGITLIFIHSNAMQAQIFQSLDLQFTLTL